MKKLLMIVVLLIATLQTKAQTNIAVYDVKIKVDSTLCTVYLTWTKPFITLDAVYGYKVWVNNILLCYNEGCNLIPPSVDSIVTSFPAFKGINYTAYVVTYFYNKESANSDMPANITDILKSAVQSTTVGTVECVINCEVPIKTRIIKTYNNK